MPLDRRRFLKTTVIAAGALGTRESFPSSSGVRRFGSAPSFPQSIASGDPKPESIVLWTRAVNEGQPGEDIDLRLQVATGREFRQSQLIADTQVVALAENDGCVRVKVTGLEPRTTYFYRFAAIILQRGQVETVTMTSVGRTRTAPGPNDPVAVRFALASCQDYIGKYYNSYLTLLQPEQDDLDFLLHVGDFIYETTGDPSFQGGASDRQFQFEDEVGAIAFRDQAGEPLYFAARSLSNYRQLYRVYRSDPVLQAVLERFPLVHVWDDHEFTDDSWRDHATYFDGLGTKPDGVSVHVGDGSENVDEQDTERRLNAEQALLEYMPIDDEDLRLPNAAQADAAPSSAEDILDTSLERRYPNTRVYRALRFGRYCNLLLTDYRTYRPDHPVPEDGFPGTLLAGETELREKYQSLFGADAGLRLLEQDRRLFVAGGGPDEAPKVDLEHGNPSGLREYGAWEALTARQQAAIHAQHAQTLINSGFSTAAADSKSTQELNGLLDLEYLNGLIRAFNAEQGEPFVQPIPINVEKPLGAAPNPYGLTRYNLHKFLPVSDFGSRYGLNADWYELWRALALDAAGGGGVPEDEDAYGERTQGSGQEAWVRQTLTESDARWNLVASSVSSTSMIVDLENEEQFPPDGRLPDSAPGEDNFAVDALRRLAVLGCRLLGLGTRIYISCDQWDGFPNLRYALQRFYREQGNVILVSGDIHSSWVSDLSTATEGPLFEFTGTAISSATFETILTQLVSSTSQSDAGRTQPRPSAPFGGFVQSLRAGFESGALTLDPKQLAMFADSDTRTELEHLVAAAGIQSPISKDAGLEGIVDLLLSALDRYLFDLHHVSDYLVADDGTPKISSRLAAVDTSANGLVVVEVGAEAVDATYLLVDPKDLTRSYYGALGRRYFLANLVQSRRFRVTQGTLNER